MSYKTGFPFGEWVYEHLLPFLEPCLENALNRDVDVFVDRDNIFVGDAWPERLRRALAYSRCMIAVWSPAYFNSSWCLCECAVMLYRERQLGYRTLDNPGGLILPINVFDGEHFPHFARSIQYLDCRDYARVGPGFRGTRRYVDFQDRLLEWIPEVANAINAAPPWSEEWQSQEWLSDPIRDIRPLGVSSFELPVLE